MRSIAATLVACLAAAAGALILGSASRADPPAEVSKAAPASTAAPAAVATDKVQLDKDVQHFLALGYRPEMHGGEQLYCRKETALGSRLGAVKNCGTIAQLRLAEQSAKADVGNAQRQIPSDYIKVAPGTH
jgi:hypothetical protein